MGSLARALRNILAALVAIVLVLVVALAVCGRVFILRPQTFLTTRTVTAALRRFGGAYQPRWTSLSFSASAVGHWRHRYLLRAKDVCLADRHESFEACFDDIDLSVVVAYSRRGAALERIERFSVLGKRLRLDLTRRPPGPGLQWNAGSLDLSRLVPPALTSVKVDALRVELPAVVVVSSGGALSGSAWVRLTPGRRRPFEFSADLQRRTPRGSERFKAQVVLDSDFFSPRPMTFVDASGRLDMGSQGRAEATARLEESPAGNRLLVFKAKASAAQGRLNGDWRVRQTEDRYAASGRLDVLASTGPVRRARLTDCRIDGRMRPGAALPSSADLSCRFEIQPVFMKDRRLGTDTLSGRLTGSGRIVEAFGRRDLFTARLSATADPIKDWYELSGTASIDVSGRLGRLPETLKTGLAAEAVVKVARFEDIVARLRDTAFAVPAPIHVLKGPLVLTISAEGEPGADVQRARYRLLSDLSGPRQRLAVEVTGNLKATRPLTPARSFENDSEVVLKEVALELPWLNVVGTPKISVDKRIKTSAPPAAAPNAGGRAPASGGAWPLLPPLKSRALVRTEKPLILLSNLAKGPIPVAVDLAVIQPPAAVSGTIGVQKFDVALFRRVATVHHLNFLLKPGSPVGGVEGLILYKTPYAVIRIILSGTTAKPRVELTSDPPMRREAILAVLIFGKNPAELDLDQTASIGNSQAALDSSAFGLTSLYLFGATPIEHVGYDSAAKSYAVTLRLPGGIKMDLSSDFGRSRDLRLRKLLAPHWAVQSEIGDQSANGSAVTTFLEWFSRY